MATILGMIVLPDGEPFTGKLKFHRCDAPAAIGNLTVVGMEGGLTIQTEPNGSFSTELKAGVYKVQIPGTPAAKVHFMDDGATYDFNTLGVPGFPGYIGSGSGGTVVLGVDFAVAGIEGLRDLTTHAHMQIRNLAYLSFIGDGQGGPFIYDNTSTAEEDGVDVARPDDVDELAAGRWHRQSSLN